MYPAAEIPKDTTALKVVGGNTYGRYPKISDEQTFNMLVSDGWLVPYPGYKKVYQFSAKDMNGRLIYSSVAGKLLIVVVGNLVYRLSGNPGNFVSQFLFTLNSFNGVVTADENLAGQIAICDQVNLWIYNFRTGAFAIAPLPINPSTGVVITPGYVTYHDSYFIVPDITSGAWYLSFPSNGLVWLWNGAIPPGPVSGSIQTKPGNAVAVLRAPGRGNLVYVFGQTVTEMWNDIGSQLFPYQRNDSISIDYGCLSPGTIAAQDDKVVWLGTNEQSGPVLMVTSGSSIDKISTDGVNFKLDLVQFPAESNAFFFRDSGHLIYQINFTNPADNFSLAYDFETKIFISPTDENQNYHIAQNLVYYNNIYYFVGIVDGDIYEFGSEYTNYDYTLPSIISPNPNPLQLKIIPRIRVCNDVYYKDGAKFTVPIVAIVSEQGNDPFYKASEFAYITTEGGFVLSDEQPYGFIGNYLSTEWRLADYQPRIDMSISTDGGSSFGSEVGYPLNPLGDRKNRLTWYQLGMYNELMIQYRTYSLAKVVITDGEFEMRHAFAEAKGL